MADKKDLITTFNHLLDDDNFPSKPEKITRGRLFENLIRDWLETENLSPSLNSLRPPGEELDGSFLYGQRVFLLETKWHSKPLPASSIYQFKGKVDGKLVGTIGVFISMSGFSTDAIDALQYGKVLNVILFDGNDIIACFSNNMGFTNALALKLRKATEVGIPFYSLKTVSLKQTVKKVQSKQKILDDMIIIVEGQGDQEIISFLAEEILRKNKVSRKLMIRMAGGKISIPALANAMDDFSDGRKQTLMLVADADADATETANLLSKPLNETLEPTLIIPDPEIEIWFQQFKIYDRDDLKNYAKEHRVKPSLARNHILYRLDFEELYKIDESFKLFYDALIN